MQYYLSYDVTTIKQYYNVTENPSWAEDHISFICITLVNQCPNNRYLRHFTFLFSTFLDCNSVTHQFDVHI